MTSPVARAAIAAEVKRLAGTTLVLVGDDDPRLDAAPATDIPWIVAVFSVADEVLASIGTQGADCWSETGTVQLHGFMPAGADNNAALLDFDRIRRGLRAARLGDTVILSSSPPQMVGVVGRWMEYVSFVEIERRNFG